jgi:archaellum component FlaG (FlaF/FlaG flagellin family)
VRKIYQQKCCETINQNATKSAKRNEVNINMVMEIIVDASELKDEGKQVIQALADYIKEKTGAETIEGSNKVTVKGEGKAVSKKYLRLLVKKFLHKQELKDYYRVISGDEDTLKVKERKLYEEE